MNETTTETLGSIRGKIDEIDQQLLGLIRERLCLAAKVGKVKHAQGLPIYDPQREASMLAKRRDEALAQGVPPQLIEDVLRRLMRESYLNEKAMGFKQIKADLGPVVIIGGAGALGQVFAQMFQLSGYQVNILDKDNWDNANILFERAGMVLVSTPINITCDLIRDKLNQLSSDCILVDLTSIKTAPLKVMLETHTGPVLGLHPMFGADVNTLAKQVILICHGRGQSAYQWLVEQMRIWGANIVEIEAKKHDEIMQLVQAMQHFSTFVYGLNLYREQVNIEQLLQCSSPTYRLELAMVSRLFAQSPDLFADIIFSQQGNRQVIEHYLKNYQQTFNLLDSGDKETFIQWFKEVAHWLEDLSPQFKREGNLILKTVNDMKSHHD